MTISFPLFQHIEIKYIWRAYVSNILFNSFRTCIVFILILCIKMNNYILINYDEETFVALQILHYLQIVFKLSIEKVLKLTCLVGIKRIKFIYTTIACKDMGILRLENFFQI
uniref:Uncharacterized protein n=1 Tax=Heterorhabditis bacteriophora TaxID=37862 RepID=A0A1I7WHT9_HETBA